MNAGPECLESCAAPVRLFRGGDERIGFEAEGEQFPRGDFRHGDVVKADIAGGSIAPVERHAQEHVGDLRFLVQSVDAMEDDGKGLPETNHLGFACGRSGRVECDRCDATRLRKAPKPEELPFLGVVLLVEEEDNPALRHADR